jgi:environmental stress-induced protein Ves
MAVVVAGEQHGAPHLLRFGEYRVQPWLNGGGQTREIAAEPAGAGFVWRLSIADVAASGPFSLFSGVDRVIIQCEGQKMCLTVDGVEHDLVPFEPFQFPGDAETYCRIVAPTRDLNVMISRGTYAAEVKVVPAAGEVVARTGDVTIAVLLSGSATLPVASLDMRPFDALRLEPATVCQIDGDGSLAVVRITACGGR